MESSPLKTEFLKDKLDLIRGTMKEKEIDAWIVLSREGNEDPIVSDLGLGSIVFRAAAVLAKDGSNTVILGKFDVETVRERGFYDSIHQYDSQGLAPKLYEVINRLGPKKIAVNTSEDFGFADGLSSGMRDYLVAALKEYGNRLVSSEDLVITLRGKLLPQELDLMKRSISECEKIYDNVEEYIKVGRADKEIHEFMKSKVYEKGMEVAWDQAPSIAIGRHPPSHLSYKNDELRDGDFLRIDFGVKYEGYCSDIQRVYFIGKGSVPREVQKMFDTAIMANDACIAEMKKGAMGYVPDKAARDIVVDSGFPDFLHGTGHPVGRFVHEVGPQLEPLWPETEGLAKKPLESDMIFTVEPSIQSSLGLCNIEQDVLVTENGLVRLSKRQRDLIRCS